ncbi:28121_t:CDS:2, partial [Racocetra persica]
RSGPEEICLPITDKDKQLFQKLITDQEEMIDIVMNEYRFLLHYEHNYKSGKLIHIMWVYICTEKSAEKVLIEGFIGLRLYQSESMDSESELDESVSVSDLL